LFETSLSLLQRLQSEPQADDWQRLHDLYEPLIRSWLLRDPSLRPEADDLVQDILTSIVRKLPDFRRERLGSFRSWLRTISVNRIHDWWRSCKHRLQGAGGDQSQLVLSELEDPNSLLSRRWDEEHDRHVFAQLLRRVQPEFSPSTWQAFQRQFIDEVPAKQVAQELGTSPGAVMVAKSRVLSRLRQEGAGLLD
jgi:RNA polymerase sigma-70 factor (ECF subfamily)